MRLTFALLVVLACACGHRKEGAPATKTAPHAGSAVSAIDASTLGVAIDVAVSQSHVCAVLASGSVACWGELHGPLASLTTRPTLIKGVTDAKAIFAWDCVLRGDKPAMCWTESSVTEIPGTGGARDIVRKDFDDCFLLANGSVSCWNEGEKKLVPEKGLTGLRAIDTWAYGEWCFVRDSGAIECSGDHAGDLGKQLPSFPDAISVMRVDQSIACAVRKGGAMTCFGQPDGGADKLPARADQIFLSGLTNCLRSGGAISCKPWQGDSWEPRSIGGDASDLSCDSNTCCAIVAGAVACWGDNTNGRLGDGIAASAATPTKVAKLPPIAKVFAGERFTMAIARDGALYAWGSVGPGPQLPVKIDDGPIDHVALLVNGAIVTHERYVRAMSVDDSKWSSESVPALPADPRALAAGDENSVCAALVDGSTRCVRPTSEGDELRWQTISNMRDVMQLSAVGTALCGVTKAGSVACLIDTRDEDEDDKPPPSAAVVIPGIKNAVRIAAPFVELAGGNVVDAQLDEKHHWIVTPLPQLSAIRDIESGGYGWSATCGIKDKHVQCWLAFGGGNDDLGLLARPAGSKTPTGAPAPITGSIDPVAVVAANTHACALDTAGAVWCWGDDRQGQLGLGRVLRRDEAARVVDLGP